MFNAKISNQDHEITIKFVKDRNQKGIPQTIIIKNQNAKEGFRIIRAQFACEMPPVLTSEQLQCHPYAG